MAEWSQLPPELLLLIVKHLTTRFDVLRFRSVCPSWRSSVPPEVNPLRSLERSQVDFVRNTFYLVRPTRSCDGDQTEAPACCWFVKIRETTDRVKLQPLHTSFREDMWCPGKVIDLTSFQVVELGHEYLVTFYDSLPKEYFENKLVFLPTHTGGRDTGFIMFNLHRLYGVPFLRLGDKEWTWLPDLDDVQDIISFNGKVYAITRGGRTRIIDQSLKVSFFGDVSCSRTDKFLVKSVDDLLVVEMLNRPYDVDEITVRFRVFRMNEEEQRWDEIGSLRDQILFVGSVQAISVSASDFGWDKGNLIFYPIALSFRIPSEYPTFEEYFDYEVWFVFDLETGTSTAHPQNGPGYRNLLFRPPRQWFTCPESSISGTQVISNSTHSTTPTTSVTTEEKEEVDGGARR